MLKTLATRRWLLAGLLAIVFAVVAVMLGNWQYSKHEDRLAARDQIEEHYSAEPISLPQALGAEMSVSEQDEWVRVQMSGTYLADQQLVVRNRPHRSVYGYEVLVPFATQGATILVDRGWVPNAEDAATLPDVPPAPTGSLEITGWLRPAEPSLGREQTPGQLASIHPPAAERQIPRELIDGYVILEEEHVPGQESAPARPEPLAEPDTGLGPHFAYALQWWLTAPVGLIMVIVMSRREHREAEAARLAAADGQEGAHVTAGAARQRKRKHRIWDDEDG